MKDNKTSISDLKTMVRDFREKRGWMRTDQKDIAISMVLEAAEVLEHFQWVKTKDVINNLKWRKAVGEEIADVVFLLMEMVDVLEIDLADTFEKKVKKQAKKYPLKLFNPGKDIKEQMKSYYKVKARTRGGHPLSESEEGEER